MLRPGDRIDIRFLCRHLENYDVRPYTSGTTRLKLNKGKAGKIKLALPPLDEQKRIAEVLDRAEALRARRRAALSLLDELTQSIFLDMFGDPKTNPKGWDASKLGTEVKVQGGYAFKSKDYTEEGVRLVKISNVHKDNLRWDDVDHLPPEYSQQHAEYALAKGDVVLALTRPIIKSLKSVKIAVVGESDLPSLLNQRVGRFLFNGKSRLTPEYVREFCHSTFFFNAVQSFCSESLQPNMSTRQIESLQIPIPPKELQDDFESRISHLSTMRVSIEKAAKRFEELFASLQSQAFKGEL